MYFGHMLGEIIKEQVDSSENEFSLPQHAMKIQKINATQWRIAFDAFSHERVFSF
jgi:hypothetical protein